MRFVSALLASLVLIATSTGQQAYGQTAPSSVSPQRLRIDFLTQPVGLDSASPRFRWTLRAANLSARNLSQSAYRILVASSAEVLAKNHGDVWDSGRVRSADLPGVTFAGRPLQSHARYFWKVRVWDQDGKPSEWSSVESWITGLIHPSDWVAKWIAAEPDGPLQPQAREHVGDYSETAKTLPIFRNSFMIDRPVKQAVVYVSGLGQYELHLNGEDVATGVMNPGWTSYRKTVLYNSYDVTTSLHRGKNAFGVLLGNGMYNVPGIKGRYTKFIGSFGQPKLILQMHVLYDDGTERTIVSDSKWKTTAGPIVLSSTYGGEDYDARREPLAGWDRPGFAADSWSNAVEVNGPNGKSDPGSELVAQTIPAIKVDRVFKPIKVTEPRPGITVYDLGQNFSGWPVLTVSGHAGDVVRAFPGELLDADGLVTQASGGGASDAATYFTYTLHGGATEVWHPRFSYYGFRYVQVERTAARGSGTKPALLSIEGAFVHSSVDATGEFSTSQPLLGRIHHLIDNAILSNTQSLSTDCPTREKLGWLEQTQLAATSIFYNYDVARLYEKISNDMRDSQFPDGFVPTIAPEYVAFVFQNGANTDFRDSPEWGSAVILSPWQAFQFYGNREGLTLHYAEMQRYAEYLKSKSHDGIVSYGLGDWYDIGPNFPGESQLTDKGVTATATYYQDLDTLARIARILGKNDDNARYAAEAQTVKDAFNRKYFHPDTDQYDRNSQTANAMALALSMVPDEHRVAVLNHLVDDIRAHNNHVTAGDVGFHYVVRALTDGGRSDVLTDMLLRTDPPSYGYQLAKGATSLTEAWDSNPASSQNHLMLGHAEEWFYRGLAGIAFDLSRPAGERIVIRPAFVDQVPDASARLESVLGAIVSRWARRNGTITVDVEIPAGATGLIELPVRPGQSVHGDVSNLSLAEHRIDGKFTMRVGSGRYHFDVQ